MPASHSEHFFMPSGSLLPAPLQANIMSVSEPPVS